MKLKQLIYAIPKDTVASSAVYLATGILRGITPVKQLSGH